ncbi:MAG: S66 peptidase family protein [Brevinema sp.]
MQIGKKIVPGATIGITAVSSSLLDLDKIKIGAEYLKSLGYKVKLAPNIERNDFFFPGSPQVRAEELMKLFLDPDVDMIMALRGGFGAIQILDLLDYDIIKKNPKVFVGFSDLTSLQMALYQRADLITFYGPMLSSNFADPQHSKITDQSLFSLVSGENKTLSSKFDILVDPVNQVEGRVLGGNFITFMSLMGTKFQPDLKNSILFFEEIDEKTYALDRAISQLLLNEQFSQVKAFIFGDFNNCTTRNQYEEDLNTLIVNRLKKLNVPIISGLPCGHCHPMITFPLGSEVCIDLSLGTIQTVDRLVQ